MKKQLFLNQGAVNAEVHTYLSNYLSNRESKKAIRNHHLIHATLIISIRNITAGNQICASAVDWRTISLQIVQNQTLWINKFIGTLKSLKTLHTD